MTNHSHQVGRLTTPAAHQQQDMSTRYGQGAARQWWAGSRNARSPLKEWPAPPGVDPSDQLWCNETVVMPGMKRPAKQKNVLDASGDHHDSNSWYTKSQSILSHMVSYGKQWRTWARVGCTMLQNYHRWPMTAVAYLLELRPQDRWHVDVL